MSEYENEPIPGLPAHLPEGEKLLWQGSPGTAGIARHVMHIRLVAAYFAILIAWRILTSVRDALPASDAVLAMVPLLVASTAALGLIWLLSMLISRTTIYSITSQRVVMRFGVALPMTVNIPFSTIRSADLGAHGNASGDIALEVQGRGRLGYVHLWPHVRPWHLREVQPSFRCLPDVASAGQVLSRALHAAHGQQVPRGSEVTGSSVKAATGHGTSPSGAIAAA